MVWLRMFRSVVLVGLLGTCQAAWNITCDFDLENIEEIVNYLPVECQEIYKLGSGAELYAVSLQESSKFQEFTHQLEAYERKESSTPVDEVPQQNTELRFQIYSTVVLTKCAEGIANRTESLTDAQKTNEYYNCLLTKRGEMINLIPK